MPFDLTTRQAIALGETLATLRADGVMIVGSGGLTHNLQEYFRGESDQRYAVEFARWMHAALTARDARRLTDYRSEAPHARRAHPTEEHFLPLLVAYGASADSDAMDLLAGGWDRVLSMDSYFWDAADASPIENSPD